MSNIYLALNSAGFTCLGFFLPNQVGRVAWEQKTWGLVAINGGFDLVRLMLYAFILAYWIEEPIDGDTRVRQRTHGTGTRASSCAVRSPTRLPPPLGVGYPEWVLAPGRNQMHA